MTYNIDQLMEAVETWLVSGDLNPGILSDNFVFSSPFWRQADKKAFLDKFLDPTEYIEKSLSNIIAFDPIIRCVAKDNTHFTLVLKYHTQNDCSIDEAVVCKVEDGLVTSMNTIYDLAQTKQAHNL